VVRRRASAAAEPTSALRHGRRGRRGRQKWRSVRESDSAHASGRAEYVGNAIAGRRLDPGARGHRDQRCTESIPVHGRSRPAVTFNSPPRPVGVHSDFQHNSSAGRRAKAVHVNRSLRATSPEGNTNARQHYIGAPQLNVTMARGPRQSAGGDALEPQTGYLIQIATKCVQPGYSRTGPRKRRPGQTGYCRKQRSLHRFTRVSPAALPIRHGQKGLHRHGPTDEDCQ
jgi:hypothetical protein